MIMNCNAYSKGRRLVSDLAIDDIRDLLKEEGAFVWLGLYEPDEGLMRQVQEQFNLHDLAVEDAHCAHQRPKLEVYGESLFVVLRTAQLQDGKIDFGETHIFIGPHYVVTVRHGASLPYTSVRTRCECLPQFLRKGPGFVLYTIMDFVVDNYFPIVDGFEEVLEELEDQIFKDEFDRAATERIYELKRDLVRLRRAVVPLTEVCNRLLHLQLPQIPEDIRPYFRDVYDHVLKINEAVDALREMIATALEVSLSLVAVGQNEVTKRLAGWGAILALPTMVFSVYGMNFDFIPELHWQYGYGVVMAIVFIGCLLLHRRLKKAGWL